MNIDYPWNRYILEGAKLRIFMFVSVSCLVVNFNVLRQKLGPRQKNHISVNEPKVESFVVSTDLTVKSTRKKMRGRSGYLKVDGNETTYIPSGVIAMAPEIFKKIPRNFLPQYKNPCWLDAHNELNCLPYFYVIGMAKCGTTELWDKITQHPDVVSSVPKEPHWWARRRHGWTALPIHSKEVLEIRKMTGRGDDSSVDWYLNWFKKFGVKDIDSNPTRVNGTITYPRIFGDSSITTSFDQFGTWRLKEQNYSNAHLLHAIQPHVKIIMTVRDPVERIFSEYNYAGEDRDYRPRTFEKFASVATDCSKRCHQQHSDRFCVFTRKCYINQGLYFTILREWISVYGREGVHLLRLEDWRENKSAEYSKILQFLDLPPLSDAQIRNITTTKAKNVNTRKSRRPAMSGKARKILQDFFRPHNRRLAEFMNDTRYLFGY